MKKITNIVDRIEDGRGGAELDERLAQRRAEKLELTKRVERLGKVDEGRRPEPTESWVDERLRNLGEVLSEDTPAANHALRDLVGGKIVVKEIRLPGRQRFHLQGRFSITSRSVVKTLVGVAEGSGQEGSSEWEDVCEEFIIEFLEPAPIEALSEQAKELYDQGLMNAQIADQLGCARSRVTEALKFWFESRDKVMPDGRSRRATLKQKHLDPPLYQEIAEQVMTLYGQKMLLQDIADRLKVDRNTITSAIRWWHEEQNLPVPDGRARRKELGKGTSNEPEGAAPEEPPEENTDDASEDGG